MYDSDDEPPLSFDEKLQAAQSETTPARGGTPVARPGGSTTTSRSAVTRQTSAQNPTRVRSAAEISENATGVRSAAKIKIFLTPRRGDQAQKGEMVQMTKAEFDAVVSAAASAAASAATAPAVAAALAAWEGRREAEGAPLPPPTTLSAEEKLQLLAKPPLTPPTERRRDGPRTGASAGDQSTPPSATRAGPGSADGHQRR